MKGSERKYLRGLAHNYKPHLIVGKNELTKGALSSMMAYLEAKELMKVKFSDREYMKSSKSILEDSLNCHVVGDIGKVLILYKKNFDKTENNIVIPD